MIFLICIVTIRILQEETLLLLLFYSFNIKYKYVDLARTLYTIRQFMNSLYYKEYWCANRNYSFLLKMWSCFWVSDRYWRFFRVGAIANCRPSFRPVISVPLDIAPGSYCRASFPGMDQRLASHRSATRPSDDNDNRVCDVSSPPGTYTTGTSGVGRSPTVQRSTFRRTIPRPHPLLRHCGVPRGTQSSVVLCPTADNDSWRSPRDLSS